MKSVFKSLGSGGGQVGLSPASTAAPIPSGAPRNVVRCSCSLPAGGTWSVSGAAGFSIDNTGLLMVADGTAQGNYTPTVNYTVVSKGLTLTVSRQITVSLQGALAITGSPPDAQTGQPYSYTFIVSGWGQPPYVSLMDSASLAALEPRGFTYDGNTHTLSAEMVLPA